MTFCDAFLLSHYHWSLSNYSQKRSVYISNIESFQNLAKNSATFCLNNECDDFIEEMPNPCLKIHQLNSISENRQEYEDTISDESGYSETGDTVSGKSTNETS